MVEKAVCYIRVSTPRQKRQSPAKQWGYIQEYMEEKGWQGVHPKLRDVELEIDDSFSTVVEYIVKIGDTLSEIADHYSVKIGAISNSTGQSPVSLWITAEP